MELTKLPVRFADDSGRAVYGCSFAETAFSNPAAGMYVCLFWVLCNVR